MDNSASPLDTLRQLKEMLDAGALTPAEFEALKQRLVFTSAPAAPPTSPLPPVAAPAQPATVPFPPSSPEQHSPMFEDAVPEALAPPPMTLRPAPPVADSAGSPFVEAAEPEALPEPSAQSWVTDEFPATDAPPARNPLSLILSIGGLLALLGLVLYLSLNRRPSEHISSTSQTAADSVATTIDTGPPAEMLPPPAAAPETIRLAPAHPAAPLPARPAPPATDSAKAPVPAASPDSAAGQ
ncbi:SHOCT domain-containing protein [Hymenobacter rubidus]|uniref:SHOCT domain-containing protein n=1 Tax=Hymenobacter rubidus TaxID=1441626 RepID=UPI00191FC1E5|nr:SHOCT domain-containing protein [Hymenobacter rubidus]